MQYAIITATGFQMSGPEAALYDSAEEAGKHMSPGDQIVPVVESAEVVKFTDVNDGDEAP